MGLHRGNPPKSPFFKGGLGQTKLFTDKFLIILARMNHPEGETAGGVMEPLRSLGWVRTLVHMTTRH